MANKTLKSTTFVIFGAGGDLSTRKILPAIYKLVESKKLSKFCIIGLARTDRKFNDIIKEAKKHIKTSKKDQAKAKKIWEKIEQRSTYLSLDFNTESGYQQLKETIHKLESRYNKTKNRLFYLATLPTQYQNITKYLTKYQIATKSSIKFSRIAYEKPFGTDQITAKKINKCINKVFHEKLVYRIDHYLGKELVSNMALLRFTNRVLEPLWSNKHIEKVDIVMTEKLDIGKRGNFYDNYGALKDVVQNHLLQLVALTAMEQPKKLEAKYIRDQKVKVLQKTKIQSMQLGQYNKFTKVKGVKKNSKTDTFAALKLTINNSRWRGVPFNIKTGKALNKKETYIDIKFKHIPCLLQSCPRETNHLRINIKDPNITLKINSKLPGTKNQVIPISLKFSENLHFDQNSPKAYENLIEQIIQGDQSAFVRSDEVEASWKIIDAAIKKHKGKLLTYKKGSTGPKVPK
ncbi:glucose-6-phosphate dehydrogenase [archaeon]|jgi:glucose-6-phosphate 1-dehydrogenase|nr:glucose-6-phosphate dehydrogenase [archaeon]MBT6762587.1 glucose-6-phosphate dehydrogenase [archaeon]